MKLFIPTETAAGETRVALNPDAVKKLIAQDHDMTVQAGAGERAGISDDAYKNAGAKISNAADKDIPNTDFLIAVRRPQSKTLNQLKKGARLACLFEPADAPEALTACAKGEITAYALDLVPRITRAQAMDILSSQANLAGYRAVIEAAEAFDRAMPMMMTAAGTIPPARVLILGAGVAGLQAIATARRLGAIVCATDVRPAAKQQVESLGASFVAVEDDEFKAAETAAGYAKPMSDAYQAKQNDLIAETLKKQDIVITTALIPGRAAPLLISAAMAESMGPGSLIIDLAAERGGNCALTKLGQTVTHKGIRIIGPYNGGFGAPRDASNLLARNILAFLTLALDPDTDPADEILAGVTLTNGGKIVHPDFAKDKPS
ncbi:MAG: Re/Si-specific NAD(P)(+) transhydrogenase subunit alpha [Pseudomonadota bacterium]